ncbi:MAG: hypothetical protein IID34_06470 [Planctomycetes bacterium]|nr:hypothetical protein [Planctomycetota bacterium]MCH8879513.1 hypothetical protein [Planctomycetota bacterium]MCH8913054.1 hypothetical protein [Planctomycetota bacterium]MCH8968594.1 hypothetical protein [Planctomycetota bacterium]MCZ6651530.1 hypothetical protein [Planctomycetota bacterium]
MKNFRHKFLLYGAMAMGCLCETVGCTQLVGNALRDGTNSFLNTGLTAILLSSLDLEQLLGITTP